jgi:hypothetical protein
MINELSTIIKYNQPDSLWENFGLQDHETYCKKVVVRGLFQPNVPKDVREAFIIAEYMMANAYYHAPLYHEAFSKVLRIIEMAIKLKCKQLNISLEYTKKAKKYTEKKVLKELMNDLILAEPEKKLANQFNVARTLRNLTMHPDHNVYSGAMTKNYIKQSVTLLNTLFTPENIFIDFEKHLGEIKQDLIANQKGLSILEYLGKRYLVERVDIKSAILINHEWHFLLVCYPIMLNAFENLKKQYYLKPLILNVSDINFCTGLIKAIETNKGVNVTIISTDQAENQRMYNDYLNDLQKVEDKEKLMYEYNTANEIGKREVDFWYEKLWKISEGFK